MLNDGEMKWLLQLNITTVRQMTRVQIVEKELTLFVDMNYLWRIHMRLFAVNAD